MLSIVSQISTDPVPPPSRFRKGLDPRLDAICLKALARQPADRFASMRAFAEALAPWLEAEPPRVGLDTGPSLTLRIAGTPFAYRPAPTQQVISLGRQKRRPGEPPEMGNDVVLRVPGNDTLSSRISRRHLEIHRQAGGFVVIDRSRAGTTHNGHPLTRDVPVALAGGDRLVVAGVLTLEVDLHGSGGRRLAGNEVAVPRADATEVVLEASVGDMVTLE
jgi:hypothetical protein